MDKRGEIEAISIEAAENGYMVVCRYAPAKAKKPEKECGPTCAYVEPERYVYETPAAVLKKVGALLGGIKKKGGGLAGMGNI